MKECLDGWREVLFTHLDQEVSRAYPTMFDPGRVRARAKLTTQLYQVEDLSGENMKKYWTLEEVDRIHV